MGPVLVVTVPPLGDESEALAWVMRAKREGADAVEVRTDLHPLHAWNAFEVAQVLPVLVAERDGKAIPSTWERAAKWVDRPLGGAKASVISVHCDRPMRPEEALAMWRVDGDALIKHVEPLGDPRDAARLFETQRLLKARFGERVTVLCTGELALPFRCALSTENALDYVALSSAWASARGQRLLRDARRSRPAASRLGILGSRIEHSRSPRIHPQPFDRIDLPESVHLDEMLAALHPHYRGFAVTSPFKQAAARAIRCELSAVNTLVRTRDGWRGFNTDVDGARAILPVLGDGPITVLGGGGVTSAISKVSQISVVTHASVTGHIGGSVLWTWPAHVDPPSSLRLDGARVAVIAYGPPAWRIARRVRELGGVPLMLGPRWFIAQARAQQALWRDAE